MGGRMHMTRRQVTAAGLAAATAPISATAMAGIPAVQSRAAPAGPGLHLGERFIPVPKSVSREAQELLTRGGNAPAQSPPAADDLIAWKAYVEAGNLGMAPMVQRLANEHPAKVVTQRLSSADLYEIEPSTYSPSHADLAILYVHGGGFTVGFGISSAYAAHPIAGMTGVRTFSIDYGMPPERPYPAGLDDTVEAYRFLLKRYSAQKIAVYGPSAGGGLAAAFLLKARDLGLPLPAACVLASPEADLTESGDTFETNDMIDVVLKHRLTNSILLYANGHDLTHPYLSPLFGDFTKGFPPTLLTSGTRDLFLSNTVRLHRALRKAGIGAELHVWEAMPHGAAIGTPESQEMYDEQIGFIKRHLGLR